MENEYTIILTPCLNLKTRWIGRMQKTINKGIVAGKSRKLSTISPWNKASMDRWKPQVKQSIPKVDLQLHSIKMMIKL